MGTSALVGALVMSFALLFIGTLLSKRRQAQTSGNQTRSRQETTKLIEAVRAQSIKESAQGSQERAEELAKKADRLQQELDKK
jgi:hypothetical protein